MSHTLSIQKFRLHSKHLFKLAFPIFITLFFQTALAVVDTIMAGHFSTLDLSAIAVGTAIWVPLFLLVNGVLFATTPLIGEAIGRKEYNKLPFITQQGLWSAVGLSIIFVIILLIIPNFFSLLTIPENIQPIASDYLYYVSLGIPAMGFYLVLRCYCEAFEHPIPISIISVVALFLNIPVNYIFIYGKFGMPMMGGAGCGIATTIVEWISLLVLVLYLNYSQVKDFAENRLFKKIFHPNLVQIKKFVYLGVPMGMAMFFEASLFHFASIIVSSLGEVATASHRIALSVSTLLFIIPLSISTAVSIMVANRFGKKNLIELKQVVLTGLICTIVIAIFLTLFMWTFNAPIARLFSNDINVQELTMYLLLFAGGYQIFDAIQITINGVLRGIQDTKITMYVTFICYWLITLPLSIYLVHYTSMEVAGFWLALIIGLALASCCFWIRLQIKYKVLVHSLKN